MYIYGESICIPFLPYFQILCWWPDEGHKWPTHAAGCHRKWFVCEQLKIGVMDWLVLHMRHKYMLFIHKLKTGWIWEGQAHVLPNFESWKRVQNHILACASFLVPHTACFNKLYIWFTLCADVLLSQYLDHAAAVWGLVHVWLIWVIKLYAIKFYPYGIYLHVNLLFTS